MSNKQLAPDIHWVGAIDWDVRDFHGYSTLAGTTYNAFLIMDEKITLIDTVKRSHYNDTPTRVRTLSPVNLRGPRRMPGRRRVAMRVGVHRNARYARPEK